jgi:hypothetical protein
MTNPGTLRQDGDQALEVATYLWEEYHYRHNLVWQLVFRVTAVGTLLLVAPLLANQFVRSVVHGWLVLLPIIAILVIVIGIFVLQSELRLLKRIRDAYRAAQNQALQPLKPYWVSHKLRL